MKKLTHTNDAGKARMVDVGNKDVMQRVASASGFIRLAPDTVALIRQNEIKKGEVITVAEIAGVQAAKQTSLLIPLCHHIVLENIRVVGIVEDKGVRITSEIRCTGKTGAEMEALTAVSVALLTVYDMCKAVDTAMEIGPVHLTYKSKTPLYA